MPLELCKIFNLLDNIYRYLLYPKHDNYPEYQRTRLLQMMLQQCFLLGMIFKKIKGKEQNNCNRKENNAYRAEKKKTSWCNNGSHSNFFPFEISFDQGSQLYVMEGQRKLKIYSWGPNEHLFKDFPIYFYVFQRWSKGKTTLVSRLDLALGLPIDNPWIVALPMTNLTKRVQHKPDSIACQCYVCLELFLHQIVIITG